MSLRPSLVEAKQRDEFDKANVEDELMIFMEDQVFLPSPLSQVKRETAKDLCLYLAHEIGKMTLREAWDEVLRVGVEECRARRAMESDEE